MVIQSRAGVWSGKNPKRREVGVSRGWREREKVGSSVLRGRYTAIECDYLPQE
jgi:hypothetical protein